MYTFMCTGKNPKAIFKNMYGGYHGSQLVFTLNFTVFLK